MPYWTDNLLAEHRLNRVAAAALQGMASHVLSGGPFPVQEGAQLLRFMREFLLGVHARKEIELLAPLMAMQGSESAANLVGELTRLHADVRDLVLTLVMFWEPEGELTPAERRGFADTVNQLEQRLASCQQLEEQHLFGLCARELTVDDQLGLQADFAQLERERGSASDWEGPLLTLAARWAKPAS